jgi:thiamine-monophosphate kinase
MPARERDLIRDIRRRAATGERLPELGIGDDCAILSLPRGHQALVTTDFSLEDIHFRREWHPADSVGHRCLARGLSDIAAMGGTPWSAFLSLALPADLPQKWVDGFIAGFLKLAKRHNVTLAGGDIAQSPDGILADIVVLGSVSAGTALPRSGARPGDLIYVTGELGGSSGSLQQLRAGKKLRPSSHLRHFYPEPRLVVGQALREKRLATAMIDLSDGLSTDLGHICEESGVGAVIEAAALPATPDDERLQLALHGGEDYELLFTASPRKSIPKSIAGVAVTRIGEITRGKQMKLMLPSGKSEHLEQRGWEHFS